jgi:thiamine pyrophosphate-dependent acetolactate synthase large subunit-like protein
MDILAGNCPGNESPSAGNSGSTLPPLPEKALAHAADLLDHASFPVIIAGGGAWKAWETITKLAEKSGAMVVESCAGKGIVDERNPLCIGARSHFPCVREYLGSSDLILAFGTELSPTDLWEKPLPKNGTLVQVDLDRANFPRNGAADIGIIADAGQAALALLEMVSQNPDRRERAAETAAILRSRSLEELQSVTGMGSDLETMSAICAALREAIPEEGVLFADMTGPAYAAISEYPAWSPKTFLHPVGFGTLGLALPAAIGAAAAKPGKPVCVLAGDGGFQFTLPELAVAVQESLPIPIVIWNDGGFGEIRRNEDARHPGVFIAVDNTPPDFELLASAYGAGYARPEDPGSLALAVKNAFSAAGPTIIECSPGKGSAVNER